MSEEQVQAPESLVVQIRKDYKAGLADSNVKAREHIVKDLVDKEVRRRAEAAQKVFDLCEATQNELRRIKPTFGGYDLQGKGVGEPVYTQEQAKKHKELTEKVTKYEKALEKALVEGDFSKVFELASNQPPKGE